MNKKLVVFIGLIGLCLLVGTASATIISEEPDLVDGYYQIESLGNMQWFAEQVNAGHVTYNAKLLTNLNYTGETFTCIGTSSNFFNGIFDGNGFTISNTTTKIMISSQSSTNAEFRNTCLKNCRVTEGFLDNINTVSRCYFDTCSVTNGQWGIQCKNCYDCYTISCSIYGDGGEWSVSFFKAFNNGISSSLNNVYAFNSRAEGEGIYGAGGALYAAGSNGEHGNNYITVSNCVLISGTALGYGYGAVVGYGYHGNTKLTNINSYQNTNISSSSSYAISGFALTKLAEYNFFNESFYHGGSYLNWDFVDTWYWDSEDNLPKLQVFRPVYIESLTLTSSSESPQGTPITATVTAVSSKPIDGYQWYTSQLYETLTVVYSSDQTNYPFNENQGITVTDGINYFRYYPLTDVKTPLEVGAGVTWDVVNIVDYVDNGGSAYIKTGYSFPNGFSIDTSISINSLPNVNNYIIGGYANSNPNTRNYILFKNNIIGLGIGGKYRDITYSINMNQNYIIKASNYYPNYNLYVDDVLIESGNTGTSYYNNEFYLMAGVNPSIIDIFNGKLYYAKIYDGIISDNTLIRDYIPIQYGSTYALYDYCLSGNVIYGNAGSGSFTGGGTPTPLTYTRLNWQLISGQTSSTLSYSDAPIGDNYFKVIVSSAGDSVDSVQAGFQPLHVLVISPRPIIHSLTLVYPTGNELPLGQSVQGNVNASMYDGTPVTYQWLYSLDNVTYTNITDGTSANLTYSPQSVNDYCFKVIVSGSGYNTDSIEAGFDPLNVTVFNGIMNNTITNETDFVTWNAHYPFYQTQVLMLGNDVTFTAGNTPIPQFNGTFNGNENTLYGLTNSLITNLSGNVQNLNIQDSLVQSNDYAGLVSTRMYGGIISNVNAYNCHVNSDYAGGITGAVLGENVAIQNCDIEQCTIIGDTVVGGITPVTQSDTAITNVHLSKCDILSPNGYAWGVSP